MLSNKCQRFLICIYLYEPLASNIKIKVILPLVFGVHWLNRIPLLLWLILSKILKPLSLSNACGLLILSSVSNFETTFVRLISNTCKEVFECNTTILLLTTKKKKKKQKIASNIKIKAILNSTSSVWGSLVKSYPLAAHLKQNFEKRLCL